LSWKKSWGKKTGNSTVTYGSKVLSKTTNPNQQSKTTLPTE
jgi:hypothetical protein